MRKILGATGLALALTVAGVGQAQAGVYSDDLAKCLVKSASPADVSVFMVWLFSAMTLQPDIKPYSSMTPAQRDAASKSAAELLQRLMIVDCHKETVTALQYEGVGSMETGFNVFGQVAGRGLFSSPEAAASMAKMATYLDATKFEALGKEAGLPSSAKVAPK